MDNRNFLIGIIILLVLALGIVFGLMIAGGKTSPKVIKGPEAALNLSSKEDARLFDAAQRLSSRGDLLKAREAYQEIIDRSTSAETVRVTQGMLDNLNIQILFSRIMTPDSESYEVQKGDNLIRIAKKFNTTAELIAKANGLKDDIVRLGQKLKISKARFSIVVDKSQNILTLKSSSEIIKTYRVSTGKKMSTPVGAFKITNKIVDPPWYPSGGGEIAAGDPKNVLGSRWLGISKPGYGIHGTTEPESIGNNVTEGCVRMKNSDVEELYVIVPEGTEVVIVD